MGGAKWIQTSVEISLQMMKIVSPIGREIQMEHK
jgi:hypothetical protein